MENRESGDINKPSEEELINFLGSLGNFTQHQLIILRDELISHIELKKRVINALSLSQKVLNEPDLQLENTKNLQEEKENLYNDLKIILENTEKTL